MRRGVLLLVLGVVGVAAFGAAAARADSADATTTSAATTGTTTTTTASYAPLSPAALPAGCVGAGAAAVVSPARSPIALGLHASGLGASGYPSSGAVLTFGSSTASGSTCKTAQITLDSVSLFGGAVTASSVQSTNGTGTVTGLAINGAAATATAGESVAVDGWGILTLGSTVGRVTAPLVLRLMAAHDSLPAGTVVAVGFAALARPAAKPNVQHRRHTQVRHSHATTTRHSKTHQQSRRSSQSMQHPAKKGKRSYFWSHYDFPAGGLAPAARKDPAVSIALRNLGIPYRWARAKPRNGFDCSGLVQYVFSRLGVWLPHNAAAQWHSPDTRWVSPGRLEPGDLVFFKSDGTRKMPGHVGIYIGGGELIDAPHTGSFVRVDTFQDSWFARQFVGARRVTGVKAAEIAPESIIAFVRHKRAERRRLLAVHAIRVAASAAPLGFLAPLPLGPASSAVAVAVGTGADASAADWTGLGLGSALLLLLPGAFTYRRRRRRPGL